MVNNGLHIALIDYWKDALVDEFVGEEQLRDSRKIQSIGC
jgi:hypothetical protein